MRPQRGLRRYDLYLANQDIQASKAVIEGGLAGANEGGDAESTPALAPLWLFLSLGCLARGRVAQQMSLPDHRRETSRSLCVF